MDIRSILSSDVSQPAPSRSSPGRPIDPLKAPPVPAQLASPYQFGPRRDTHPIPPPQLQSAHSHNGEHPSPLSASHPHFHRPSPSQYTLSPSSAATSGQYPFPPSLPGGKIESPQAAHGPLHYERAATMPQTNGQPYALNQQHPPLLPPTLATAAPTFPPPHYRPSSVHSATPTSAHSQGQGFHRDGSSAGVGHSPIQQAPPYHLPRYQSFSDTPTGAHPASIDGRSPVVGREGSVPHLHEPSSGHSSAPYLTPSHKPLHTPEAAAFAYPLPAAQPPAQQLPTDHEYLSAVERERSESVSPKSMAPKPKREANPLLPGPPLHPTADGPNGSGEQEQRDAQPVSSSHLPHPATTTTKAHSSTPEREARPEEPLEFRNTPPIDPDKMDVDAKAQTPAKQPATAQTTPPQTTAAAQPAAAQPAAAQTAEPLKTPPRPRPKVKREKFSEVPVWARKVTGTKRTRIVRNKPPSGHHHLQRPVGNGVRKRSPATTRTPPPQVLREVPVEEPPVPAVPTAAPTAAAAEPVWEKSITTQEPAEELTKVVADWLFMNVVQRPDPGPGAALEVEAKLGQLVDRHSGERLRLPVQTECVLADADPSVRVAFHSTLHEDQHRALNAFLNDAVLQSQKARSSAAGGSTAAPPRVKITYVHTRESDAFYELDAAAESRLAPSVRGLLAAQTAGRGARDKPRIRRTVDQKTGAELARLVKLRLADLDVHCPRAPCDVRISVNLEAAVPAPPAGAGIRGDEGLVEATDRMTGQPASRRNKDRLTYRHQACQIDLTQVTLGEGKGGKEHELEVELQADMLREEGVKTRDSRPSLFVDVVRGFVDNVRLLVRHCPA